MKIKIKRADALAAAKQFGFTGDDPALALAHCVTEGVEFEVDGKSIAAADCELEADTAAKPKKFKAATTAAGLAGAAGADEPRDDIMAKAKAEVFDALVKAGVVKRAGAGFQPVTIDTEVTNVQPVAKSLYEAEKFAPGARRFQKYENAEAFKLWVCGRIHQKKHDFAAMNEADAKFKTFTDRVWGKAANTSNSVTGGGALVPEGFLPDLIRIALDYGVADKLTRVIQLPQPQVFLPRRTGGTTMSYVGQASTATETNPTYDNVKVDVVTGIVYTTASMQMLADPGMSFTDMVFEELAYSIAKGRDDALLIGDGSATYGGQTGFENKYGGTATDGGYVVVGGGTASAHTAANINSAIGRMLPLGFRNPFITCTPTIKAEIFDRLADSTPGGLTLGELTGLGLVQRWKGIPIITNNSMSAVIDAGSTARGGQFTAGDQIDFLIGDFGLASKLGTFGGIELDMDKSVLFASYSVAFRGVVRFNSVVHDVGTSSTAGPVVSFWQT